jgi:quinol-cytochrome oxidoreductase complex cytochrome b subunit
MPSPIAALATALDRRVGRSAEHPSLWPTDFWRLVGHLAIAMFVLLAVTGIALSVWYRPSTAPVVYTGSAALYDGATLPQAFATVVHISEDVPGGLLLRRVHMAASHVFLAAIAAHLLRVMFTGAYRRPRLANHLVGLGLLLLALGMLYTGENLLYDLVSGASLRIGYSALLSIPLVGDSLAPLVFGGEFPAGDVVTRSWILHVFVLPPMFVGGLLLHLWLVHRRTPASWQREDVDVQRFAVGRPLWPDATARFALLGALSTAIVVASAAFVPWADVELEGPFRAAEVTNTLHPPWTLFFLSGGLRVVPAIDLVLGPVRITNVFVAGVVVPGLLIGALAAYPLVERWRLGDDVDHHELAHPLDVPMRAGVIAALTTVTVLLTVSAAVDSVAFFFRQPVETIIWALRIALLTLPVLATVLAVHAARRRNATGAPQEQRGGGRAP